MLCAGADASAVPKRVDSEYRGIHKHIIKNRLTTNGIKWVLLREMLETIIT